MKYRKKPIPVEAVQWFGDNIEEIKALDSTGENIYLENGNLRVKTLEGVLNARVGDFIVKGIEGEIYPVKKEVFKKTYIRDKKESKRFEKIYNEELERWKKIESELEQMTDRKNIANREYWEFIERASKTKNPFCIFNEGFLDSLSRKKPCQNCPYYRVRGKECYKKGEPAYVFFYGNGDAWKGLNAVKNMVKFLEENKNMLVFEMEEVWKNQKRRNTNVRKR